MQNNLIQKRFEELLLAEADVLIGEPNTYGSREVDFSSWIKWATNVQNLLSRVFGVASPHYQNFLKIFTDFSLHDFEFENAKSVFLAAKEDYEGGYLFNIETAISGEIFASFVSLAKAALRDNNKDVAAVLAAAALEDSLKRFANKNDLDVSDKSMQEVVSALKSKGLVGGAQKGLLDTMPKIRDYAMHANWDKIKSEDVSSIIGFVEQFLLNHF